MSATDPDVIGDGKVVSLHYTLRNGAGETLDTSQGGAPLEYLHGAGNIVPGLERGGAGRVAPVWVAGIEGDQVRIDFNHPLAGETLHFHVSVVAVRDASPEELQSGHPRPRPGC